ncbi:tRNA wybutosine-synthesizing protein 2 homolog isoform X2 [Aplysia californica]|uniref:tRNA(Phe) (4-demethylwyosine(37)-C(7)) aminocarboxypropyltransferase n=1 Tax=Aplysia californica TaxID=6500 RepID=A0ABM0JP20_APLCA|nr:tRNA wybutosine-synthesizing protein 2 homolog isoform X2 [Aplysia californica]
MLSSFRPIRLSTSAISLLQEVPKKWERHGDLVILPVGSFSSPQWDKLGVKLWEIVVETLSCQRLARSSAVSQDGFRSSQVRLLRGDNGWVMHVDNEIKYGFDVTKCMFSSGNVTEKLRVAGFDCKGLTVVDLYAGIGYFTLPYLVHAGATHVHACEWNPSAVIALRHNLEANGVAGRCTVYEGDNRQLQLTSVADVVNLGLIPSSEPGWPIAVQVLKVEGGIMHIHGNVSSIPRTVLSQEVPGTLSMAPDMQQRGERKFVEADCVREFLETGAPQSKTVVDQGRDCHLDTFALQDRHVSDSDSPTTVQQSPVSERVCERTEEVAECSRVDLSCACVGGQKNDGRMMKESGSPVQSLSTGLHHLGVAEGLATHSEGCGREDVHIQRNTSLSVKTGVNEGCCDVKDSGSFSSFFAGVENSECNFDTRKDGGVNKSLGHSKMSTSLEQNAPTCVNSKKYNLKKVCDEWSVYVQKRMAGLLEEKKGGQWSVRELHVEVVKSYAPHVWHVVLDLECRPLVL